MSKIVKSFLVSFVVLILVFLIVAAFLPNNYSVSRSIDIQGPQETIYDLVSNFEKWKKWGPWYETEPNAQYKTDGNPGQENSSLTWSGKAIGNGQMYLKGMSENKLYLELQLFSPNYMKILVDINFEKVGSSTRVVWRNKGTLSYPFGRLIRPTMDKRMGDDIMRGLNNLKNVVEQPSSQ